jgi:nucleotide-binding universal stress UspA family protein
MVFEHVSELWNRGIRKKLKRYFKRLSLEGLALIKSVLVGVDGSENSDRALDFALDLADKYGASLTILNVSQSVILGVAPQESAVYPAGAPALIVRDLRLIQNEIISRCVDQAREAKPNLSISSMVREGDAAFEIVDVARIGRFDIVVIGHGGLSKMSERFLGSVSETVAHSATCTAIIVK